MKRINKESLDAFIKECQTFYVDKHLETIQIYELNSVGDEIKIGNRINVSSRAIKQTSDSVSLDVRYFWFTCAKLKEEGKSVLMVHNHGNQSQPSPRDEKSYENARRIITYCGMDTFMFCIYAPSELFYRVSGEIFDEKRLELL